MKVTVVLILATGLFVFLVQEASAASFRKQVHDTASRRHSALAYRPAARNSHGTKHASLTNFHSGAGVHFDGSTKARRDKTIPHQSAFSFQSGSQLSLLAPKYGHSGHVKLGDGPSGVGRSRYGTRHSHQQRSHSHSFSEIKSLNRNLPPQAQRTSGHVNARTGSSGTTTSKLENKNYIAIGNRNPSRLGSDMSQSSSTSLNKNKQRPLSMPNPGTGIAQHNKALFPEVGKKLRTTPLQSGSGSYVSHSASASLRNNRPRSQSLSISSRQNSEISSSSRPSIRQNRPRPQSVSIPSSSNSDQSSSSSSSQPQNRPRPTSIPNASNFGSQSTSGSMPPNRPRPQSHPIPSSSGSDVSLSGSTSLSPNRPRPQSLPVLGNTNTESQSSAASIIGGSSSTQSETGNPSDASEGNLVFVPVIVREKASPNQRNPEPANSAGEAILLSMQIGSEAKTSLRDSNPALSPMSSPSSSNTARLLSSKSSSVSVHNLLSDASPPSRQSSHISGNSVEDLPTSDIY